MNRQEIFNQLTNIFQEVFDDETISLEDSTSAKDIDEWDSLNHINLILMVEQTFRIKMKTSEVAQLNNVREFIDLIMSKQRQSV